MLPRNELRTEIIITISPARLTLQLQGANYLKQEMSPPGMQSDDKMEKRNVWRAG
jgi:hypothetical protein